MSKGTQTQKSSQNVQPPDWAKPLLTTAASSAMGLYNSGSGYNPYRGPTVADFSPQKIDALNNIMKMTGGGQTVSNASMTGDQNSQIAQIRQMIAQQQQAQQAARAQAAAAAAARAVPPGSRQPPQPMAGPYSPGGYAYPGYQRMGSNR